MALETGHAFLTLGDSGVAVIRSNSDDRTGASAATIIGGHVADELRNAIVRGDKTCDYSTPDGDARMAGLAPVSDKSFGWIVGLEIDEADVLRPIDNLSRWLLGVNTFLALLIVGGTWLIAKGITRPLKVLTRSAQTVAQGNLAARIPIRSTDELAVLAAAFNEMAGAIAARETQLQEMTRNLDAMVRNRTLELENSHEALKLAYLNLQNTQEQLVQTEKMASLGQLGSGIAHEIKNPLNFIYGNTDFLRDYTEKLQRLIEKLEALPCVVGEDRLAIEREKEAIQYDFIRKDLKILIDNCAEGAERINTIVNDLRSFSRMDTTITAEVDLHALVEMSLNLLRNQYKNRVEIHRIFGDIPMIRAYAGKLNQVFMNLLANAFYAIADKGDVWIRTNAGDNIVTVEIEDNGAGISNGNLKRIFEPFFTTKPVGQGTGLGLSISYGIIEQHHGEIQARSVPGKGTLFSIQLPIDPEKTA